MPVVLDNAYDRDGAGKLERVLGACQLRLQVPPTVQYLRTIRLVAADAADRAGFDCEETDDLRIAVDEVCHSMLRSTDAPITVGFCTERGRVEVRGAAERVGIRRRLHLARLSHLIVDAVSDEVELAEESWGIRFKLVKRGDRSQASSG